MLENPFKKKVVTVKLLGKDFDSVTIDVLQASEDRLELSLIVNSSYLKGYHIEQDKNSEGVYGGDDLYKFLQDNPQQAVSIRLYDSVIPVVKNWKIPKGLFFTYYRHLLIANVVNESSLVYTYSYNALKYTKEQTMSVEEFLDLTKLLLRDIAAALRVKNEQ